jgi:hypothetical protein
MEEKKEKREAVDRFFYHALACWVRARSLFLFLNRFGDRLLGVGRGAKHL